jgi:two-component system, NarL family, response regulator NreC
MAKVRVLIVDDHAILRAGLRLLINNQADMEIVGEAAEGHEALRQAREANPDVLTLDLSMPGGSGLMTLEHLRRACPQTRVLVLTMHEDASYLRAALAAGASGYVAKSAVDGDLLAAIRSVAQGRTFVTMNLSAKGTHQVLGDQPTHTESRPRAPAKLLSSREQEVLKLLAEGYTNKEAGAQLRLSVKTIETYRARLADKLGLRSRADLTRYALEMGLLNPVPSSPG